MEIFGRDTTRYDMEEIDSKSTGHWQVVTIASTGSAEITLVSKPDNVTVICRDYDYFVAREGEIKRDEHGGKYLEYELK